MRIGELGEQKLIQKIAKLVAPNGYKNGIVGIGDDAAVTDAGKWLVTTKDLLVENIHFLRHAAAPRDLGHKALAVNLSDIAAMGAIPRYAYVALALPKELDVDFVLDFYSGMKELADLHGVVIAGGDTVGSPGPLVVSVTVQGEAERDKVLLRDGAKPGDLLCATGQLGASAAGLMLLLNGIDCPEEQRQAALDAHFRPMPRVQEALFLAASGAVTSALDLSDGLLKDLDEICKKSGCGALLYEEKIPVHSAASCIAPLKDVDPLDLSLSGGEDYELLLTVKAEEFVLLADAYSARFGTPLIPLGEILAEQGIYMFTKTGKREEITFKGFQHF